MIYFIQAGENGLIKIGYSYSPEERLAKLQTANPIPLKMLTTLDGDKDIEAKLHRKFKDFRTEGEWFYPVKPIMDFIKLNSIEIYTEERKKLFVLDKSMIATPSLFDLTTRQLLGSPPANKINEYRKLVRQVILSGLIPFAKHLELTNGNPTNYECQRVVDTTKEFINEVGKLSSTHYRWMSQVYEALIREVSE